MKHELKSLKRSLRVKSSLTSTNSNSNNMTNMKNVNYSIVGKSKTLERIGYHMNNNNKKNKKRRIIVENDDIYVQNHYQN